MEFFPQCLEFLFLFFNRGEIGDDAVIEVFDCFQKGFLFGCRFKCDSVRIGFRKQRNMLTTMACSGFPFATCPSFILAFFKLRTGVSVFI